jgi:hypothetical protein
LASSHILVWPLHYPSNTHGSHFYKLTNFDVVEFFSPYGLLTLKKICDLTSFCYSNFFPPSHIHKEQTQKKKRKKKIQKKTQNKPKNKKHKKIKNEKQNGERKKTRK